MLLHVINDNILISHLPYSGVYQYEAKNESSTKRLYFGLEPDQKNTDKPVVHVSPSALW